MELRKREILPDIASWRRSEDNIVEGTFVVRCGDSQQTTGWETGGSKSKLNLVVLVKPGARRSVERGTSLGMVRLTRNSRSASTRLRPRAA